MSLPSTLILHADVVRSLREGIFCLLRFLVLWVLLFCCGAAGVLGAIAVDMLVLENDTLRLEGSVRSCGVAVLRLHILGSVVVFVEGVFGVLVGAAYIAF